VLNWLRKFSRAGRADTAAGAEQHYELGRRMRAMGEPARAVTCFRKAIELDPAHVDARVDLASALLGLGALDLAEEAARGALAHDPRSTAALVNLGAALAGQGRFDEGAARYRDALAIDQVNLAALVNLAATCVQTRNLEEAERAARAAIQAAPDSADAHAALGNVRMEQRDPAGAATAFREAIRLRPSAGDLNNLGFALDLLGDFDGGMRAYEEALRAAPDDVTAHLGRAAGRLLQEDYAGGWEEYEWRQRAPRYAPFYERFPLPRWEGGALAGKRILVYAEQGLGDELLFASCLSEVVAQAAHCVIDCEPRLERLFRRSFPTATVRGGRQTDAADWLAQAGPVDACIPAGSLPRHLRRAPAAFPDRIGYLQAAPERVAHWQEKLRALGPGLKVGLSWRGGVPQTGRGLRSLDLDELLPVLSVPDVRFVNLQYGQSLPELAALRARHGLEVHHWQEAIDDYDETAALVAALDLTLSVCTAVVDLAGALGRPAWVLAPVRSDFRYGLQGERMPWYPSVRMFRQQTAGDWTPVLAEAARRLAQASL
jgi:Tfp pilus assembly protein PilF